MKSLPLNIAIFRITFGIIWAIDATFKWLPNFQNNPMEEIMMAIEGQPDWIAWPLGQFMDVVMHFPHVFSVSIAILETLLALALILGIGRKITYIAGMVIALGIWIVGEGLGGPYMGESTDIGAAIIYVFVFWGLLLLDAAATPVLSLQTLLKHRLTARKA